jgi:hypothetical protein
VEACPVGAIFLADDVPARWTGYVEENARFFEGGEGCLCHPA